MIRIAYLLIHDKTQLGLLKLEGISENVIIFGAKNYIFGDKKRSKGIPTNAQVSPDGQYSYWRFTTFKDYLRSNGQLKGRVLVRKQNTLTYTKGITETEVIGNRGQVKPHIMEYDECQQKNVLLTPQVTMMKQKKLKARKVKG
jgi:hypothetical protein